MTSNSKQARPRQTGDTLNINVDKFIGSHAKMQALQKLDQPVLVTYKNMSKTPLLKKSAKKSGLNVGAVSSSQVDPDLQTVDS